MSRAEIVETIHTHYPEIARKFDVASISLFGSAGRDELRADSDVDVLVQFNGPATFDGYFDLKFYLQDLLKRNVDLATESMIRPEIEQNVRKDAVNVA